MLCGERLSKRWGRAIGLREVDVGIRPGEITCVIGPSGGGKSTLLRALCLVEEPDHGRITIDGTSYDFPAAPSSKADPPWPTVTMVFQRLFLWPHISLRDNVALPLAERGVSEGSCIDRLAERLNVASCLDQYPNEASLGQRQRVALIRALALEPRYLLLDEITSALDVEQVAEVAKLLREFTDRQRAVVITTHLLGFARRMADQVLFLESGEIKARGRVEILEKPDSKRLEAFLSVSA